MSELPDKIENEQQLDELVSTPAPETVDLMKRLDGDILLLGAGGKIGPSLARTAIRAIKESGTDKKVIGVDLFPDPEQEETLRELGVETVKCDLLDRDAVAKLPDAENVVYMAGRKFGTSGSEELTWMINTVLPDIAASRFKKNRIVAFSTGCVYDFVDPDSGGSLETDAPGPVGEYSQSCLGRERVFEYYAKHHGTRTCLFRLNYSVDLRYGVLHDIAEAVKTGTVDVTMGFFNVIWQGDVNNLVLRCFEHCESPAKIFNVTGPETGSTCETAAKMAEIMGTEIEITGTENERALLSNASMSHEIFGEPSVPLDKLIEWQAHWSARGGRSLGKPTHFEETGGNY